MFTEMLGEPVRQAIKQSTIESVDALKARGINPKLAVIRVGEDPGQLYYENAILSASESYGIETQVIAFGEEASQAYLDIAVQAVNADHEVHGVIMLRPFPKHIDEEHLRQMLDPKKDVDAITDISIANTFMGRKDSFFACTAEACVEVLDHYEIPLEGRNITVVGRSLTVGKPLAIMLLNRNATVTVCHSRTPREEQIKACKDADIVILATGQTESYGSDFFRDGQIIVDVGTGTGKDGKMHGDLNLAEIKESGIITDMTYTPVPGGVGKVTTALLMRDIVHAAEKL